MIEVFDRLIGRCRFAAAALFGDGRVAVGPAVAEELPHTAHLLDHIEVEIGDNDFILVAAGLGDDLSARVAEITLAVELTDGPWLLGPNAVDRAHEVAVGNGMR